MASPNLINAVSKHLLKPGVVARAKKFFEAELDEAMGAKDRTATRDLNEVLAAIEKHEANPAAAGNARDRQEASPAPRMTPTTAAARK